jgi:ribosome-associated protein
MSENSSQQLLERLVSLAQDKKAYDIVSLELGDLTLVCDYFLIMSAMNTRQAQAICDNMEITMKHDGLPPLRIEGYQEGRWILLDFSNIVVHIFLDDERKHYNLERLWGDAKRQEY